MKLKVFSSALVSLVVLTGCAQDVYQDNRMSDSSLKKINLAYNTYATSIVDSAYNWYSKYVNEYLNNIKADGYKTDVKYVESLISDVDKKKNEVENISVKDVRSSIDNDAKESSKNYDSEEYKKIISEKKNNVNSNKKYMLEILGEIKSGLELGLDGEFSKDDQKKLKEIQVEAIRVYGEKIKK